MALNFKGLLEGREEILSGVKREFNEATLIVESNTASATTNTVYEVGVGKKFWLVSMNMDVIYANGVDTTGNAARGLVAGDIILRAFGFNAGGTKNINLIQEEFLELEAGQKVEVASVSGNVDVAVSISGYEMPAGN